MSTRLIGRRLVRSRAAARAGTFVVPPIKAEEMYLPEVFGCSGADWVIVEDQ